MIDYRGDQKPSLASIRKLDLGQRSVRHIKRLEEHDMISVAIDVELYIRYHYPEQYCSSLFQIFYLGCGIMKSSTDLAGFSTIYNFDGLLKYGAIRRAENMAPTPLQNERRVFAL